MAHVPPRCARTSGFGADRNERRRSQTSDDGRRVARIRARALP
jgi:hypothetical protein